MNVSLLNTPKVALIDDEDYSKISTFTWSLYHLHNVDYAATSDSRRLLMHHFILAPKENFHIDHRDRNGLNNQKSNLRYANYSQNAINKALTATNTSGYKGVSWNNSKGRYVAQIKVNQKNIHLGYFYDPINAAKAYNNAAAMYFGEFAYLNPL